jgi:hypothetical protein
LLADLTRGWSVQESGRFPEHGERTADNGFFLEHVHEFNAG